MCEKPSVTFLLICDNILCSRNDIEKNYFPNKCDILLLKIAKFIDEIYVFKDDDSNKKYLSTQKVDVSLEVQLKFDFNRYRIFKFTKSRIFKL